MYSLTEIQLFIAQLFQLMDPDAGSQITIPITMTTRTTVKHSPNFWSAWMKFKEMADKQTEIGLTITLFRVEGMPEAVRPITSHNYNVSDILAFVRNNPNAQFTMLIRFRSKETFELGVHEYNDFVSMN